MTLRAATRGSALARWQTDAVIKLLDEPVEVVVVETTGDKHRDVPIADLGRGVFVKEVQAAVLAGRADFAVHSAKDLPSSPELQPDGLVIAAVPERGDPRDAVVGARLEDLPPGALVGTGSPRRRAQVAALRPDLTFADLRGNVDTRLAKVAAGDYQAIVVALAALIRLEREDSVASVLEPWAMVPQVAQGALAVECRAGDEATLARLAAIQHGPSRAAVDAERAFLARLGGSCNLPAGAYARLDRSGDELVLTGLLCSHDGRQVLRRRARGTDGPALGRDVAGALLGCLAP